MRADFIDLAPNYDKHAYERDEEAGEENDRGNGNWLFGHGFRNDHRPKGREIQYCRYDNRVRAAKPEIVEKKARQSDYEEEQQSRVAPRIAQ